MQTKLGVAFGVRKEVCRVLKRAAAWIMTYRWRRKLMQTPRRLLPLAGLALILVSTSCSSTEPPSGDPIDTVRSHFEWYVKSSEEGNRGIRCIEFDKDYYLVEIESQSDNYQYIWVSRDRTQSGYAVDAALRAKYVRSESGKAWFLCAPEEPWPGFPYYILTTPHDPAMETRPWYRSPSDDQYVISKSGDRYRLGAWGGTGEEGGFAVTFVSLDFDRDRAADERIRPPRTIITESGTTVRFRFEDVYLQEPEGESYAQKDPVIGWRSGDGTLVDFVRTADSIEFAFETKGSYSYFDGEEAITLGNPRPGYVTVFLLFGPVE